MQKMKLSTTVKHGHVCLYFRCSGNFAILNCYQKDDFPLSPKLESLNLSMTLIIELYSQKGYNITICDSLLNGGLMVRGWSGGPHIGTEVVWSTVP